MRRLVCALAACIVAACSGGSLSVGTSTSTTPGSRSPNTLFAPRSSTPSPTKPSTSSSRASSTTTNNNVEQVVRLLDENQGEAKAAYNLTSGTTRAVVRIARRGGDSVIYEEVENQAAVVVLRNDNIKVTCFAPDARSPKWQCSKGDPDDAGSQVVDSLQPFEEESLRDLADSLLNPALADRTIAGQSSKCLVSGSDELCITTRGVVSRVKSGPDAFEATSITYDLNDSDLAGPPEAKQFLG